MANHLIAPQPHDLANSDLFRDVPETALSDAVRCAVVRHLPKGTTVFAQDQRADRARALLAGRVRIAQGGSEGEQLLVRFVGPGEIFGAIGLFTGRIYPAQATTVLDSIEISWSESALLTLIELYPQIAINLVKITGKRLRDAEERLRELATQPVERRIAHVLLRLAGQAGQSTDEGTAIDFPLSRKDIADMCGASLHTVSRTLTAWEKAGWIETSRQRVTVRNRPELRKRSEDTCQ
jgi:CRP-like cAMP-binding protein